MPTQITYWGRLRNCYINTSKAKEPDFTLIAEIKDTCDPENWKHVPVMLLPYMAKRCVVEAPDV